MEYAPGDYFPIYWLDSRPYGGQLGYCVGPLTNENPLE